MLYLFNIITALAYLLRLKALNQLVVTDMSHQMEQTLKSNHKVISCFYDTIPPLDIFGQACVTIAHKTHSYLRLSNIFLPLYYK